MPRLRPLAIAWVSVALLLVVITVVAQALRLGAGGTPDLASPTAPLGGVLTVCGPVILSRRPGHVIGGVLVGFGLLWAFDGMLEAWYGLGITPPYGTPPDDLLPGTAFAYWFVAPGRRLPADRPAAAAGALSDRTAGCPGCGGGSASAPSRRPHCCR